MLDAEVGEVQILLVDDRRDPRVDLDHVLADELTPDAREWVETHGVPDDELVELACRSMKCVAQQSDAWRERLLDLRYRLGDVAAA